MGVKRRKKQVLLTVIYFPMNVFQTLLELLKPQHQLKHQLQQWLSTSLSSSTSAMLGATSAVLPCTVLSSLYYFNLSHQNLVITNFQITKSLLLLLLEGRLVRAE